MSDLPPDWTTGTLGEIGIASTNTVNPSRFPTEDFDLFSVPAFARGEPDVVIGAKIGSTKQLVEAGDVLLCKIVPHINRVWVVPDRRNRRQIASSEWIVIRNRIIDPEYMRYCLSGPDFREIFLQNLSGIGGSLTRARPQAVKRISVPIAPRGAQRGIVAMLDELLGRSRQAQEELEHIPKLVNWYKQAILASAFRGELTTDWRYIHPDATGVVKTSKPSPSTRRKRCVSEESSDSFEPPFDIPPKWQWLCLPDLGDLDRGRSRHRPRNHPSLYGGPYPFVQTGDVKAAEGYLNTYTQTYSEAGLAQSRLWPAGTLCITIAANIAETAILGIDACFPDSVVGFTADRSRCDPRFVEFFVRTVRADLAEFAPATAQKNINLETLRTVHVPCPPLAEQIEIVDRINRAFLSIDQVKKDAARAGDLLQQLDRAILAKAFRGELRLPALDAGIQGQAAAE